jgi:putative transposase
MCNSCSGFFIPHVGSPILWPFQFRVINCFINFKRLNYEKAIYRKSDCFGHQETGSRDFIKDICREPGISEATFYNWKAKFGGMEASDVKRIKDLETENAQLKSMYAEACSDLRALKNLIEKKLYGPEFISHKLDTWSSSENRRVSLQFIQPGKPMQNG